MNATAWANAVLLSVCAGLCIGCAVYALLLAHLRRQTRSRIEAMLPSHEGLTSAATSPEAAKASATGPSKAVEEWVRYRLLASRRGRQLLVTYQLARSGSASLWPLINIALLATLGFLLLLLLTRNLIGAVLVSAAALGAAYWRLLQVPAQMRLDQIRVALPEALAGMSNALRSGATIVPALEQAAKDAESPLKEELEQVVANVSIGQDLRTALSAMRARVPLASSLVSSAGPSGHGTPSPRGGVDPPPSREPKRVGAQRGRPRPGWAGRPNGAAWGADDRDTSGGTRAAGRLDADRRPLRGSPDAGSARADLRARDRPRLDHRPHVRRGLLVEARAGRGRLGLARGGHASAGPR